MLSFLYIYTWLYLSLYYTYAYNRSSLFLFYKLEVGMILFFLSYHYFFFIEQVFPASFQVGYGLTGKVFLHQRMYCIIILDSQCILPKLATYYANDVIVNNIVSRGSGMHSAQQDSQLKKFLNEWLVCMCQRALLDLR